MFAKPVIPGPWAACVQYIFKCSLTGLKSLSPIENTIISLSPVYLYLPITERHG